MRVEDVMTRDVATARPETGLKDLVEQLAFAGGAVHGASLGFRYGPPDDPGRPRADDAPSQVGVSA
jgi:hypothetical protein